MKKILFFTLSLYLGEAMACNPNVLRITRSTGMTFKLGKKTDFNGGVKYKTEIPVTIGEARGCFTQKSGLDFDIHISKNRSKGKATIYLPKTDFKIIDGETRTYLKVLNKDKKNFKFSLVSFTCAEDATIATESFTGDFNMAHKVHQSFNLSTRTFFSTGMAAHHLASSQIATNRVSGYSTRIPKDIFQEFLKTQTGQDIKTNRTQIQVPSVFMSQRSQVGDFTTNGSYTTISQTMIGCTREFRDSMEKFEIKNLNKQLQGSSVKARISRNKVKLKWK